MNKIVSIRVTPSARGARVGGIKQCYRLLWWERISKCNFDRMKENNINYGTSCKLAPARDIPLEGYDGAVYIAIGNVEIDVLETQTFGPNMSRSYNRTYQIRASMVYHELLENYYRTHGDGMTRDEAHKKATAVEWQSFGNPKPGEFTRFIFK